VFASQHIGEQFDHLAFAEAIAPAQVISGSGGGSVCIGRIIREILRASRLDDIRNGYLQLL
jgi:hypothetical protein